MISPRGLPGRRTFMPRPWGGNALGADPGGNGLGSHDRRKAVGDMEVPMEYRTTGQPVRSVIGPSLFGDESLGVDPRRKGVFGHDRRKAVGYHYEPAAIDRRPTSVPGRGIIGPNLFGSQSFSLGQDLDDLTGLAEAITVGLDKLPPAAADQYRRELDRCLDLLQRDDAASILLGGKCLYDLYQDIKDLLAEQPEPVVFGPTPVPEDGFPYAILAIAAVAGVGVVLALT